MTKKQVNGAWEDITTFRKNVNGAWEDCQVASKVVDGAWEPVWNNYTPIIKDGVWMLDNESYKGQAFANANMNPNEPYTGYVGLESTLMKGYVATQKDGTDYGVNLYYYWFIPLDAIPKEIYIEGWIDGILNNTYGIWINDMGNAQEYILGDTFMGVIEYNTPQWLELPRGTNGFSLSIDFSMWFTENDSYFDYYGSGIYLPAWEINNLWVKF